MALKEQESIQSTIDSIYSSNSSISPSSLLLAENPINKPPSGVRENSLSIEGSQYGDEGKGKAVNDTNHALIESHPSGELFSIGANGAENTGHEITVGDQEIPFHQIPVAVALEGATAIIGKGKLVHPNSFVTELRYIESKLGGSLYGNLLIDSNAILTTDLHKAYEAYTNRTLNVGHGTTGSGVSQGYASWYEKRAVTIRDFMDNKWREKLSQQFDFYVGLMGGSSVALNLPVNRMTSDGKREKVTINSKAEFLDRLEETRNVLSLYVADVRPILEDVWKNTTIPVTFEAAQAGLLDPFHGAYPDITASRPMARISIPDATEGVVLYDQIALKLGVAKIPYMSSVGARVHPYSMNSEIAQMYRDGFNERGKSTGRDRGIYPIDLVAMRYIQSVAGFSHLAVTHLDAGREDVPVEVVVNYRNKKTGQIEPYRPYQWHWDQVVGEIIELPGWDGVAAKHAKTVYDLPENALAFLSLLSQTIAPVAIVSNGPKVGEMVSFLP